MDYFPQLLPILTISLFMAISPGADFVMITRNSIFYGRKAGIWAAVGVSAAIWIHVAYSIAGLALIISQSVMLYAIIKYLGAAYLIYIGWQTLRSKNLPNSVSTTQSIQHISAFAAFKSGFTCNALNPKTTIFFLSIFTQLVDTTTPLWLQLLFGAIISLVHLLWFTCVVAFLSHPILLRQFNRCKLWIERVVGSVLILFGCKVAMTS